MSVKADKWIKMMAENHGMIELFIDHQVKQGVLSYGLSAYGYDMRVSDEFKVFSNAYGSEIDPKSFDPKSFVDIKSNSYIMIPPNSFTLAKSVEYFRIPRNVITICVGKSSLARCGVITNITPFEPEWEGYVTIEISNTTPLPVRIYSNEGIAQVLFFESDQVCEVSYADKNGKYQKQIGITTSKI